MNTKILLFALFITSFFVANAQEKHDHDQDTIQMTFGKTRVLIFSTKTADTLASGEIVYSDTTDAKKHENKFEAYWAGVEFGINGLMTPDNSFNLPDNENYLDLNYGKSWFFNFNFLEARLPVYKKNIGFVTGLGLNCNNYRFLRKNLLLASTDSISYVYDTTSSNKYQKNKLNTVYLTVPLLVELNFPEHSNLHILAGVYGSLLIASHTKLIYDNNTSNSTIKNHDLPYLNQLQYGITGRIGIDDFTLFANYNLSTIFKDNKGPELYPINMGIALDF